MMTGKGHVLISLFARATIRAGLYSKWANKLQYEMTFIVLPF